MSFPVRRLDNVLRQKVKSESGARERNQKVDTIYANNLVHFSAKETLSSLANYIKKYFLPLRSSSFPNDEQYLKSPEDLVPSRMFKREERWESTMPSNRISQFWRNLMYTSPFSYLFEIPTRMKIIKLDRRFTSFRVPFP